eukprot:9390629-Ditylum_brightwellii.AAC.2
MRSMVMRLSEEDRNSKELKEEKDNFDESIHFLIGNHHKALTDKYFPFDPEMDIYNELFFDDDNGANVEFMDFNELEAFQSGEGKSKGRKTMTDPKEQPLSEEKNDEYIKQQVRLPYKGELVEAIVIRCKCTADNMLW